MSKTCKSVKQAQPSEMQDKIVKSFKKEHFQMALT